MASRNRGKVSELARLLASAGWRLVPLDSVPGGERVVWDESAADYQGNALIKAEATARATNLPAIADDSGIEVVALGGWPGLHSARWMGPEASDQDLLLGLRRRVAMLPPTERQGAFVCSLALALPEPSGLSASVIERVRGTLLPDPRGEHGFGYDPIFIPAGETRTTAEMTASEKDAVSHRGRAARQMLAQLGFMAAPAH